HARQTVTLRAWCQRREGDVLACPGGFSEHGHDHRKPRVDQSTRRPARSIPEDADGRVPTSTEGSSKMTSPSTPTAIEVGCIGLVTLGTGMVGRRLAAGQDVTVFNRTASKAHPLTDRGARLAARVADVCRGEVVITMLANDEAVEEIAFGKSGVVASLPSSSIHVSMSTISVALSEKLTAAHAEAGQRFVAAPVFGRPDAAAAGQLFIVTGGDLDAVEACAPLFEAMGQKAIHAGDAPATANLVKL